MNNAQLYFAIGLPCLTVLTSLMPADIKLLTGKFYELMGQTP